MDLLHVCVIIFGILLLLTQMFVCVFGSGSSGVPQCTSPFLSLYTIGFKQCQKVCIRYYNCGVIQYNRVLLECHLYVAGSCASTSGSVNNDVYMERTDINQAILGNCQQSECPTSICVQLQSGGTTCATDRVLADSMSSGANFVDIDGVVFGVYSVSGDNPDSKQTCELYSGRLAILDTPKKIGIVTTAIQRHSDDRWWIDGYKSANEEMLWSTGVLMAQIGAPHGTEDCAILRPEGTLSPNRCHHSLPFICEM